MAIATETFSLDGTSYTVQVANLREYAPGIAVVDIAAKRDGNSAIISDASVQVTTSAKNVGTQDVGSPPAGRFSSDQLFFPASAASVSVTWRGEYGVADPEVKFTFDGLDQPERSVCDYTNSDGVAVQSVGGVPISQLQDEMTEANLLTPSNIALLISSADSGEPIEQCVGTGGGGQPIQQGISPAVIGLGVLGVGAVAVALSQRDG